VGDGNKIHEKYEKTQKITTIIYTTKGKEKL